MTVGGTGDQPATTGTATHTLDVGGQYLVQPDEWQTARPAGDQATLVACVVAPGFDFADFTLADGAP